MVHPGRTEPIEKYFEVVERLRARGFAVLAHDWRGQGLSHRMLPDRSPGHAEGCADFLDDHRRLLDRFDGELPKPWISLGHSMGGCLALLVAGRGRDALRRRDPLGAHAGRLQLGGTPLLAARDPGGGQSR